MKHARPDYDRIQDPENLIPEDEPVFLLRGQDKAAPYTLRKWARRVKLMGGSRDLVDAARKQAVAMEEWQKEKAAKVPDLPVRES